MRTPPISTATEASRGKPWASAPISAVVPPISTTIASFKPDRKAAPRIEFVGPDAKVSTGFCSAKSALISVPSFWVRYSGALMPSSLIARRNAATVCVASTRRQAFRMAAFSRSSRPIRPISLDLVMKASGTSAESIAAASPSISGFTGENTDETAIALIPLVLISAAAALISSGSNFEISRPSNS